MSTSTLNRVVAGALLAGLSLLASAAEPVEPVREARAALAAAELSAEPPAAGEPVADAPQLTPAQAHRERHRELMRRFRELAIPGPGLIP